MAARSKRTGTRTRRLRRSITLRSGELARELLRRREKHERAIAELDALLATLGAANPSKAAPSPAAGKTPPLRSLRRIRHTPRPPREAAMSLDKIVAAVARSYRVSIAELRAPGRPARVAKPRLVAMFLAYELSGCPQEQIGSYFGGRGHTAVFHACRTARKMRHADPRIDRLLAELRP